MTKKEMHYRLQKMGFVFGKVKKLTLKKESVPIAAKREAYLQSRVKLKREIAQRDALIREWDREERLGPHELERRPNELLFVYLDESYVNRNHSLGFTWHHPDDDLGAAMNMPSGKGERFIMLTALTKHGMLENWVPGVKPSTLMLYQARKATGDYHANMDADMFCKWLGEMMLPGLEARNMEAIFVMDNASYHCTPAVGSINVESMSKKCQITGQVCPCSGSTAVPCRPRTYRRLARATEGDSNSLVKGARRRARPVSGQDPRR